MKGILKKIVVCAISLLTVTLVIGGCAVACEDDAWAFENGLTDDNDVKVCLAENTDIVVGQTLHKGSAYVYVPHVNLNKFIGYAVETDCGKQIVTGNYHAYIKGEPVAEVDYQVKCPDCFEKEME